MARDTGDDLDPDEEWPLPEGRGRSTSGSTIRRLVLGSQPFVGAKELAAEALHSEDYRARVLAANELVGWTNMHRERLKRTSAALAKIALFVGGAAGLFALTAEFSGGGGLLPGAVALGSGLLAALASAGWSRAARGEMRRMEDIVQRIASRVEKSKSTLPAPESSSPGESR